MSARQTVEDTLRANGLPVEPLSDFEVREALAGNGGEDSMISLIKFIHKRKGNTEPVAVLVA